MTCEVRAPHSAEDRGSVTAEFALTLPAVVLLTGLLIAVLAAGNSSASVQEAARAGAREVARGASEASVAQAVEHASPGSEWSRTRTGEFEEVRVSGPAVRVGPWSIGTVQAMAAARAEDQGDSDASEHEIHADLPENAEDP